MFNFFKREKPVENKDQEPVSELDLEPALPDQEDAPKPSNPAEPPVAESKQPLDSSPSPAGTLPQDQVEEDAGSHQPAAEETSASTNAASSPPVADESVARATIPDLTTLKEAQAPRKSLAYKMFSPETRLGRFMRPVLRWLAAITGLFALGLLAGYILLYQPTQRALDAALARLETSNQIVSQKAQGLESAQTGLDQAQLTLKQVQDRLDAAASENSLLVVLVDVSNARVALVEKDGAAAKTAITQAQTNLNQALPYIEKQDKVLSDLLTSRLDLIAKELVSDPQAAQSDLEKLSSDLTNLHQQLFGD